MKELSIEEKDLLLIDLCTRLPYNVICLVNFKDAEGWKTENMILSGCFLDEYYFTTKNGSIYSNDFKPYLRSMESMTDDEYEELCSIGLTKFIGDSKEIDWFNARHFDYRGLIEKGLAIAVTEENNPYKE